MLQIYWDELYHYYQHPQFGWMYVRLQTWFPFEMQVYLNGVAVYSVRRQEEEGAWEVV